MTEGATFRAWAAEKRPLVEATLDSLLPEPVVAPVSLHRAMRHAVFAGGKRVRPLLTILAGAGDPERQAACLHAGACLELIHTYSLVHDDLPALDNDDLRRGRPTVHRAFDEATAILTGDSLLTLGLARLSDIPGLGAAVGGCAVAWVGHAVGTLGMIGGQMEDLEAEARWPEDPAAGLERIHRLKTGALLTVSVRLGGLCAGADETEDHLLTRLGDQIGLLFQIGDDILDVEETSETLGKTAGKDAASEKLTYPGLYGLEESRRLRDEVYEQAVLLASELSEPDLWGSFLRYLVRRRA